MFVGYCQVDLLIPESNSLKEKRFVLNSIKARLKNKFNVSVAEVAENEKWQRSVLGVAMIANEKRFLQQALDKILEFIEIQSQVEILEHQTEIL